MVKFKLNKCDWYNSLTSNELEVSKVISSNFSIVGYTLLPHYNQPNLASWMSHRERIPNIKTLLMKFKLS